MKESRRLGKFVRKAFILRVISACAKLTGMVLTEKVAYGGTMCNGHVSISLEIPIK